MRVIAALLIGLSLMAGLDACNKSGGGSSAAGAYPGEMGLGNSASKVTVIEYASLGCPICANWNNTVFQDFKAKYIDTNKVHYVYREFMTGDLPVATAGFLLAHCVGKDKYFQIVDEVYHQEAPYLESDQGPEKRAALVNIAESAGLTEDQFDTCVTNQPAIDALNARSADYAKTDNISGTPTFVVNGVTVVAATGAPTLAELDKAIATAPVAAK
jgi:protein-disulfide isomerase